VLDLPREQTLRRSPQIVLDQKQAKSRDFL
jgi:hypothetical protein